MPGNPPRTDVDGIDYTRCTAPHNHLVDCCLAAGGRLDPAAECSRTTYFSTYGDTTEAVRRRLHPSLVAFLTVARTPKVSLFFVDGMPDLVGDYSDVFDNEMADNENEPKASIVRLYISHMDACDGRSGDMIRLSKVIASPTDRTTLYGGVKIGNCEAGALEIDSSGWRPSFRYHCDKGHGTVPDGIPFPSHVPSGVYSECVVRPEPEKTKEVFRLPLPVNLYGRVFSSEEEMKNTAVDELFQHGSKPSGVNPNRSQRLERLLHHWATLVDRGFWSVGPHGVAGSIEVFKDATLNWADYMIPLSWQGTSPGRLFSQLGGQRRCWACTPTSSKGRHSGSQSPEWQFPGAQ
ncbi:uncharacterized protein CTRU02_210879 [Colletotrichum truncatum]|uniref:Uncharacterized protein n=1 Tax=Colletotrichum truncatum TaxID=5467 RepID=A0ACC3YQA7_COLTU|nr:uncharacterized protein CTRU02_03635 [Colletotrichum truncatum]KAF6796657.1 hypothetical protein CTRU02_03635 [Colletotrichum truncatum]